MNILVGLITQAIFIKSKFLLISSSQGANFFASTNNNKKSVYQSLFESHLYFGSISWISLKQNILDKEKGRGPLFTNTV